MRKALIVGSIAIAIVVGITLAGDRSSTVSVYEIGGVEYVRFELTLDDPTRKGSSPTKRVCRIAKSDLSALIKIGESDE